MHHLSAGAMSTCDQLGGTSINFAWKTFQNLGPSTLLVAVPRSWDHHAIAPNVHSAACHAGRTWGIGLDTATSLKIPHISPDVSDNPTKHAIFHHRAKTNAGLLSEDVGI